MKRLSEREVQERQQEMNTLRRVWREAIAHQKAMTPAERKTETERLRAKGVLGMGGYRKQLVAAKDRECAGPVDATFRLRDAGVQEVHLQGLRGQLDERPALTVARRWWSQPKVAGPLEDVVDPVTGEVTEKPRLVRRHPFLVLAGPSGAGKSQAAAWCLREAVRAFNWESGRTILSINRRPFVVWHGAALASTALYGNHSAAAMDDAERQWTEAERAVVLVLDDLFAQRKPLSGPHHDRLTRLLDARHGRNAATVITVNMESVALAALLDGKEAGLAGPLFRRIAGGGFLAELRTKGSTLDVAGTRQGGIR